MMKMRLGFYAELYCQIEQQDGWYIAHCPPLDVASQGKTRNKALENIKQACALFLESCIERGTLEEVLADCGWNGQSISIPESAESFRIPLMLRKSPDDQNKEKCHA